MAKGALGGALHATDSMGRAAHSNTVAQHRAAPQQALGDVEASKKGVDRLVLFCEKALTAAEQWRLKAEP